MTKAAIEKRTFRALVRQDFKLRHDLGAAEGDIAGVVCFLLSQDAGYMTGQNLLADGGLSDSILRVLPRRSG